MVTELGAGVWRIDLGSVNAYLADDDGVLTLVDAGLPWHVDRIRRAIAETGHTLADVERVLVTHFDPDHVGALSRLGVDAPVRVGAADVGLLTGEAKPPMGNHKGLFHRLVGRLGGRPDGEVVPVSDGDRIGSFTAYHVPGHTPGHVAYVSEDLNVAFVGDLVRETGGELEASPWLLSYDPEDVRRSIHEFADREPAVEILAMGHGVPFVREGAVRLAELGERLEAPA